MIIVVVICICLVWETRAWTRANAEQSERNIVETIASDIRSRLENLDLAVIKTTRSLQVPGVWELPPELRQAVLFGRSTIETKGRSETCVIDADGRLRIMSDDQAPPAVNFSDQPYFEFHRAHPDTAVHVSEPAIGRLNGQQMLIFSKRVNDGDGNFAGIVAATVELSYFRDLFTKFGVRNGQAISLVGANGRSLVRLPEDSQTATADVGRTGTTEDVAKGVSGAYTGLSTVDGQRRLVAYRHIDGFPFIVTYSRPMTEIFAQWTAGSSVIGGALLVLSTFAMSMIVELRRERWRRATAEQCAQRSTRDLSIVNNDLEQRIGREVQSRKDTQEKLAKSQQLEALGQLAGGIAHDINNVLQTVSGACSVLQTEEADNDAVQRLTTIAIAAADRGSAVTQRLLLFARRVAIKAESVNTAVILDDLQELLGHTLGDSIVLKLDLAGNVPDLIADRMQLETVMINLATNARDAMPDGGIITVAAQAETIAADDLGASGLAPGRYVRLSVADTGIGMDEAILARATEPFFSTKGVGEGTGLGLSMAKGFAEQLGGKFSIVSRVGEGTIVSLWFPAGEHSHKRISSPAEAGARDTKPGSKVRVLVVDDNIEASELVGEWLVAREFDVHHASSGEEALSGVKAGLGVDLLLTDLSMPGMDGLQLIREIRASVPDLPVILLTGDTSAVAGFKIEDTIGERGLVLQKPVRLTELVHHIDHMLRSRATSDMAML